MKCVICGQEKDWHKAADLKCPSNQNNIRWLASSYKPIIKRKVMRDL